jgi:tetratricopeptide (TPR) repeat protein
LDTPSEKRAEALFQRGVFYRDRRSTRPVEFDFFANGNSALHYGNDGRTGGIAEFNAVAAMPGAPESLRAEARRQAASLTAERAARDASTRAFFESLNLEREALAERYPEGRKRATQAAATREDEFYKGQMERFGATKAEIVRWVKIETLASEGNPPKTLAALDALLSDASLSPGLKHAARLFRLKLFEKFGEPAKALAEYKDILARNEAGGVFDSALYRSYADFRAKAGDYAGAIADYSLLIDSDSSSSVSWYLLLSRAKLYEKAGDTAKAIADYTVVLKNFPDMERLLPMKAEAAARLARLQGKADNSGSQPQPPKPSAP